MGLRLQIQHWGIGHYNHCHRKEKQSCSTSNARRRTGRSGVFWALWKWNNSKRPQFYHIPPNHYRDYYYSQYNYNYKYGLPPNSSRKKLSSPSSSSKISTATTCLLEFGVHDIAAVAHNKVLIAALLSAAVGQLFKPFTSKRLSGRDFDFRAAFQAGGFPSTHSSTVVATATSLALERGFSDSIFGLSVVYAAIVMYDAQGVRREVGNHSRVLNIVLQETRACSTISKDRDDPVDSRRGLSSSFNRNIDSDPLLSEEGIGFAPNSTHAPLLLESDDRKTVTSKLPASAATEERTGKHPSRLTPLKESIGHSEVEVMAGAFLGFLIETAYVWVLLHKGTNWNIVKNIKA